MEKLTVEAYLLLPEPKRTEYLSSLNGDKAQFVQLVEEQQWLDELNEQAQKQAEEIGRLLNSEIEVAVFVVKPLKDSAVAFFRKPDAKAMFKIFRNVVENMENGIELCARAQLVRDEDLVAHGATGSASDRRFLDVNGNYDRAFSDLNFALLMKANRLVNFMQDQFKKK